MTGQVDVTIVTSGHDVADARLHREVAGLRAAGLSVEILGLGSAHGAPEGVSVRTWDRPGLAGRAWLAAKLPLLARGRVVMALDPDSGLTTCLVARARGRRTVVDVHEDYAALLRDRSWASAAGGAPGAVAGLMVRAAQRAFRTADLVVVADDHVGPHQARRRLVVRNLPDTSLLPAPGPRGEQPRALYIGDLRASRGLFAMLEAIRRAPDWEVDLVGPLSGVDEPRVRAMVAAESDLARRVRLHGRQPPGQAWQLAAGAWAGLLLLTPTRAFMDAVPSKLYEYLACGLPVVTTQLRRPAELVVRHQAGAVVPTGADEQVGRAVGEQLQRWSADPQSLDEIRGRLARDAVEQAGRSTVYDDLAAAIVALT
ncbi:hypothetical protein KEM60_00835 [Austwickia sp. TVS 96-490-7B]|uniref:glycosyltransferase n=1 Tax=Austwickia sp. TVS 96-490-7B TaxID=2830843 RepID=UPI001C586594|nr:glycosyltransferase [Austwickia sp. TVS 96-490-7B]MBW3084646.1 hypothetical protein [Austwickia sp. TVS 96-490-7B]